MLKPALTGGLLCCLCLPLSQRKTVEENGMASVYNIRIGTSGGKP